MQRIEEGRNKLVKVVQIPFFKVAAETASVLDVLEAIRTGDARYSKWSLREHTLRARLADLRDKPETAYWHRNQAGYVRSDLVKRGVIKV